jgi:hypothetical protein
MRMVVRTAGQSCRIPVTLALVLTATTLWGLSSLRPDPVVSKATVPPQRLSQ